MQLISCNDDCKTNDKKMIGDCSKKPFLPFFPLNHKYILKSHK